MSVLDAWKLSGAHGSCQLPEVPSGPGCNSCMPVQLKINECIVIIVSIVAVVQVALHNS